MSDAYDDLKVIQDYTKLNQSILEQLTLANTIEEAQEFLDMMEGLAVHDNAPVVAKTMYGIAYLMEGKPWYDLHRGLDAIKEAAESDEPFCWFVLGSLYLNGKPGLEKDLISAKYWIGKAADSGYKEAVSIYDFEWGEHHEGFKEYVKSGKMEKDIRLRFYFRIVLIGIGMILAILLIMYGLGVFG